MDIFEQAAAKAAELDTDIVIASIVGKGAREMLETAQRMGFKNKIVAVRGVPNRGSQKMPQETADYLKENGVAVVTASHVLSGIERGLSGKHNGVYPAELMAETLRMFGQGTKVAVECAVMALDAGEIPYGKPVVSMAGKAGKIDTILVLTPANAAFILETVIHETVCKPDLYNGEEK